MSRIIESPSNAPYRVGIAADIVQGITTRFHEYFPAVTPNHLTVAGFFGVALAGAYITNMQNAKGEEYYSSPASFLPPMSVIIGSMLCDAFDGTLARTIQKENPLAHNSSIGQHIDGGLDRFSELALGIYRMIAAHNRKDSPGEIIALTATITNAFPSLMRAIAEGQGKLVPKEGNGPLEFMGTRAGRSLANFIALILPEPAGIPLQTIIDGITILANTNTAFARYKIAHSPQQGIPLSSKEIDDAKARANLYLATTAVVFLTSLTTYRLLNSQHPKTY